MSRVVRARGWERSEWNEVIVFRNLHFYELSFWAAQLVLTS